MKASMPNQWMTLPGLLISFKAGVLAVQTSELPVSVGESKLFLKYSYNYYV